MKIKALLCLIFLVAVLRPVYALDEPNAAYMKAFGYGSLIASGGGWLDYGSYDPSKVDFKNGIFFLKSGPDSTLNLRAILPQGKTYGQYLAGFKKSNASLLKNHKRDIIVWRIWWSHDYSGKPLLEKWPAKNTVPDSTPNITYYPNLTDEAKSWTGSGYAWNSGDDDLRADLITWLKDAKPGYKLYIVNTIGFERKCPELARVGQNVGTGIIENQVPIAYETAPPIVSCTIEIK
jgi:hypothetical protein